jgi:hypothetical protein
MFVRSIFFYLLSDIAEPLLMFWSDGSASKPPNIDTRTTTASRNGVYWLTR